jgi:methylated-DNA-protein-cysteine methyltransferase related protein
MSSRSKPPTRRPEAGGPGRDVASGADRRGASRWSVVWSIVARIPRGRVATYGQIAALAGLPGAARQVGYALAALPDDSTVPWQRVVNARGEVSERRDFDGAPRQRARLEEEGVRFGADGRIDLDRFRWRGPAPRRLRRNAREST